MTPTGLEPVPQSGAFSVQTVSAVSPAVSLVSATADLEVTEAAELFARLDPAARRDALAILRGLANVMDKC